MSQLDRASDPHRLRHRGREPFVVRWAAASAVPEIARETASAANADRALTLMTTRRPPLAGTSGDAVRPAWVERRGAEVE